MKALKIGVLSLALVAFSPFSAQIPVFAGDASDFLYEEEEEARAIAKDNYDFVLHLKVPQVFANSSSTGYRKYQFQKIKGTMHIVWLEDGDYRIEFSDLVNKKFKVGGQYVRYKGYDYRDLVYPHFNYIGNNRTGLFKRGCLCFYYMFEPSYAIGGATSDNSFTLLFSGFGSSKTVGNRRIVRTISGNVAGMQGCGCADYGHLSPTRRATIYGPSNEAEDVVATYGHWRAKWKSRVTLQ